MLLDTLMRSSRNYMDNTYITRFIENEIITTETEIKRKENQRALLREDIDNLQNNLACLKNALPIIVEAEENMNRRDH